jgi:hypothetical protein
VDQHYHLSGFQVAFCILILPMRSLHQRSAFVYLPPPFWSLLDDAVHPKTAPSDSEDSASEDEWDSDSGMTVREKRAMLGGMSDRNPEINGKGDGKGKGKVSSIDDDGVDPYGPGGRFEGDISSDDGEDPDAWLDPSKWGGEPADDGASDDESGSDTSRGTGRNRGKGVGGASSLTKAAEAAPRDNAMFMNSLSQQLTQGGPSAAAPKRKNRLGQMARQRIAEKRHKEQALHKVNPEKDAIRKQDIRKMQQKRETKREKARDMGLAAGKDGAFAGGSATQSHANHTRGNSSEGTWGESQAGGSGGSESGRFKAPAVDTSLHPSWVAQQQAKAKAEALANVKFAGTKVTFDD